MEVSSTAHISTGTHAECAPFANLSAYSNIRLLTTYQCMRCQWYSLKARALGKSKARSMMMNDSPQGVIRRMLFQVLRSALFWAAYVGLFRYMLCFFKNYRRKIDRWNVIMAAFISTFAIFFEPSSRRTELALYMIPRFLEAIFMFLHQRGLIRSFEYGEVVFFALAMGIIMYFYHDDSKHMDSTYLRLFKRVWKD